MTDHKKKIYFISGSITPVKDIGGGGVVVYRHLKILQEEGYHIIFINCNANNKNTATEFEHFNLPKKKWHPPLRKTTPWLTSLRFYIWLITLRKHFSFQPTDKVISILEDQGSLLAYTISKRYRVPFYLFFHDDNIFSIYFKSHFFHLTHINKITKACSAFFVVSEPMKALLIKNGAKNVHHIYPVPNGSIKFKKIEHVNFSTPTFCYSGMSLHFHDELIKNIYNTTQNINTHLVLISNFDETDKKRFEDCPEIIIKQKLQNLDDLFNYLIEKIDVLLIFYSFDMALEVRSELSFPSKFVEFVHLGIPILIIAPQNSAIGKWAIKNSWCSYVADDDQLEIEKIALKFKDPTFWRSCSEQCLSFAKTDFNPYVINQKFLKVINE